jgi:hypothetical protein
MDSSPDLSVKLRRGSSDSRDSFYMGFAQGIDSDIEEVTTIQNVPPPPQFPQPEEPPIDLPLPAEEIQLPAGEPLSDVSEEQEEAIEVIAPEPETMPLPPISSFQNEEDEDETITSVTVIPTTFTSKSPSSSSSSLSSDHDELVIEAEPFKNRSQPLETDFGVSTSPLSNKSVSSKKSRSLKSPPKKLDFQRDARQRLLQSDSVDSINAIDCRLDDDNRDDSSPTDSMPPAPTPPPLEPLTLLEKRYIWLFLFSSKKKTNDFRDCILQF